MIHILRPPSLTMTNTLQMASGHLYFSLSCIPLLLQIAWRDFEVEWNSKNLQHHHLSTKCSESLLIHEFLHILYLGLEILWQNYFRPLWKTGIKKQRAKCSLSFMGCYLHLMVLPSNQGRKAAKEIFVSVNRLTFP